MRLNCSWRIVESDKLPSLAAFKSASSGRLPQRKYESRDASSWSVTFWGFASKLGSSAEEPNFDAKPQKVTDHELASRLSYFLWGSLPDDALLKAANEGNLSDSTILQEQFKRMLGTENSRKVRNFSQNFIEQWLGTRALGREFKPDKSIRG